VCSGSEALIIRDMRQSALVAGETADAIAKQGSGSLREQTKPSADEAARALEWRTASKDDLDSSAKSSAGTTSTPGR
jgi:hypothetical protein